ncbi:MAG: hypothetical protein COA38_18870 [Fluviicola sp.]|nr:MAG: hypothetical protein COA38_18870 [Fluviicola sp.]
MPKRDTSIHNMTREQLIAEISMLKENHSNDKEVFDSISDVVVRVDNDGYIQTVSPSIFEVFGYLPEEVLGEKESDYYLNPLDYERRMQLINEQGFCKQFLTHVYKKNGTIEIVSVDAKPYADKQGNQLGIESVFRDITQQKTAVEKLSKNAILLNESQRLAHLGHWSWDIAKNSMEWSSELHRIYGIDESELEDSYESHTEKYHELLNSEDLEKIRSVMEEFLQGSENQIHYEECIIRKDGEIRFLETWATLVRKKDGSPGHMFGACLDITEKKLLVSKEEFQNLFELAPDARLIYKDDVIINVNPSFLNLYGYSSKDEIIGKSVASELVVPNHIEQLDDLGLSKAFSTQKIEKVSRVKKDGSIFIMEVQSALIQYNGSTHIQVISRDITERNQLEEEVKRNTLLLEESEKIAHLGHLNWSLPNDEVFWSDEVYRICGVNFDIAPTINYMMSIIHADDLSYVVENLNLALQQVKKYKLDHRIICANTGEVKWVQTKIQFKFDTNGNLKSALGTILDITEKTKDQNALLQSEEEFRSIYENSPCGIPLVDLQGNFLKANQRFIELFGYSGQELLSMNILDISHPDDRTETQKKIKALISGKISHFELEKCYVKKSGEEFTCHTAVTVMLGLNGMPEFLTASLTDITEKKKIQEILKGISEIQFAFIGEETPETFFEKILHTLLKITYSRFGYIGEVQKQNGKLTLIPHARAALSEQGLQEITPQGFCQNSFDELTQKVLTTGKPILYNKADEIKVTGSSCSNLENFMGLPFYSKNELVGIIAVANKKFGYNDKNVRLLRPFLATCSTLISAYKNEKIRNTELQTSEQLKEAFTNELEAKVAERTEDLQRTQKELSISLENEKILGELKSRFVSTASHQFRTPLTVIQSNMGILSMQKGLMDDALKTTFEKINNRIITQIGRMTAMMNDLLILGKIDLGSIVLELEPIDLVGLCGEIIVNYNEIQDDNRNMTLTVIGEPSTLELDANLITHAISNLVSNAFKYSENKPAPTMKLVYNAQSTQLSIIDYGLGIPEEDIINLFEPFYRASNVAEVSGTGLGTTIAKEYIELNQGSIEVKSTLLEGTEFILTF